jgi:hypothetical protein
MGSTGTNSSTLLAWGAGCSPLATYPNSPNEINVAPSPEMVVAVTVVVVVGG